MNNQKEFDLIILGAGIAGLSAADSCVRSGYSCAVVDPGGSASGASGAPLGLLNPATGRRAKMSWRADDSLALTTELLKRIQKSESESFYSPNGVLRPAPDEAIAEEMRQQLEKTDWPQGWVEWLDKNHIQSRFPDINNAFGGVFVPVASTVSLEGFTRALCRDLQTHGVQLFTGRHYEIENSTPWVISFSGSSSHSGPASSFNFDPGPNPGYSIRSSRLLCATGYSLVSDPEWEFLPFHGVKGQLLSVDLNEPFPLNCSVSSRGYMAVNPKNNRRITLGSTYQHSFETTEPEEHHDEFLIKRQEGTWPGLRGKIKTIHRWGGVRVTTPDRKPIAGSHPSINNLYVLGGLGSKGLMHGPLSARFLIDYIFQGNDLPGEIDLMRYF